MEESRRSASGREIATEFRPKRLKGDIAGEQLRAYEQRVQVSAADMLMEPQYPSSRRVSSYSLARASPPRSSQSRQSVSSSFDKSAPSSRTVNAEERQRDLAWPCIVYTADPSLYFKLNRHTFTTRTHKLVDYDELIRGVGSVQCAVDAFDRRSILLARPYVFHITPSADGGGSVYARQLQTLPRALYIRQPTEIPSGTLTSILASFGDFVLGRPKLNVSRDAYTKEQALLPTANAVLIDDSLPENISNDDKDALSTLSQDTKRNDTFFHLFSYIIHSVNRQHAISIALRHFEMSQHEFNDNGRQYDPERYGGPWTRYRSATDFATGDKIRSADLIDLQAKNTIQSPSFYQGAEKFVAHLTARQLDDYEHYDTNDTSVTPKSLEQSLVFALSPKQSLIGKLKLVSTDRPKALASYIDDNKAQIGKTSLAILLGLSASYFAYTYWDWILYYAKYPADAAVQKLQELYSWLTQDIGVKADTMRLGGDIDGAIEALSANRKHEAVGYIDSAMSKLSTAFQFLPSGAGIASFAYAQLEKIKELIPSDFKQLIDNTTQQFALVANSTTTPGLYLPTQPYAPLIEYPAGGIS